MTHLMLLGVKGEIPRLFDHLVRTRQQRGGNIELDCSCGLQVHGEVKSCGLQIRQITGVRTSEDQVQVMRQPHQDFAEVARVDHVLSRPVVPKLLADVTLWIVPSPP